MVNTLSTRSKRPGPGLVAGEGVPGWFFGPGPRPFPFSGRKCPRRRVREYSLAKYREWRPWSLGFRKSGLLNRKGDFRTSNSFTTKPSPRGWNVDLRFGRSPATPCFSEEGPRVLPGQSHPHPAPPQGEGKQLPGHGKAFPGGHVQSPKKKSHSFWASPSQLAMRHLGPVRNLLFRTKDQTTRTASLLSRPSFLHKTPHLLQKNS